MLAFDGRGPESEHVSSRNQPPGATQSKRTCTAMRNSSTSVVWATVAVVCEVLVLFPIFWIATMAVKPTDVMFARPTVFLFTPTFEHFQYVVEQGFQWNLFKSVSTVSTLLVVVIGTPGAYRPISCCRRRLTGPDRVA